MTTSPAPAPEPGTQHVDVLIVGAGLSGIGAAVHLQEEAPGTSYVVLEAREASGGTWDQFRYPGIRSDSDMFTLGFDFAPWPRAEAIASGPDILEYLRDTARQFGVDQHIRYRSRAVAAEWSGEQARWSVAVENPDTGERTTWTCQFLYMCSGYYRYDQGYTPDWPAREDFGGTFVHAQHWPEDLDLTGKRAVVIGSGATAVTLVPAMAEAGADHVTMLQRSPSYVMPLPGRDPIDGLLRKLLRTDRAYRAIRWKNIKMSTAIYQLSRKRPELMKARIRTQAVKLLPAGYDVDTHFTPSYDPWDQRMCLVPDGDFFASIKAGRADVVTDHIESFTPTGLRLRSGRELEADVVVAATGLNLVPLGGIPFTVDGERVRLPERVAYKGMMLDGVPNMAFAIGYTNASWTLKVDRVSSFVSRLVHHMRTHGFTTVTPQLPDTPMATRPFIDMQSGYFERARSELFLQGDQAPWQLQNHYAKDAELFGDVLADPALELRRSGATAGATSRP
ncbi:flavin-containing monooxygenase [Blastococcus xanthinilyticus]|uniref:Cation diffusion facilitator CzcD-associated flavoprotein CzcO n=1 Tax=Blastococcus xanthinilyticus TaxID=1564164 RepID=A0A5S5D3G3_9ACTN|nr:NAD(P)/FAD-dependent oxidoreductase [Blastococcus xanthinilyticus]TYP90510.1 cation diffusion facilitator CzcD-associated flavoprotein CzcO [Blastococcus xanthinilyticus]